MKIDIKLDINSNPGTGADTRQFFNKLRCRVLKLGKKSLRRRPVAHFKALLMLYNVGYSLCGSLTIIRSSTAIQISVSDAKLFSFPNPT